MISDNVLGKDKSQLEESLMEMVLYYNHYSVGHLIGSPIAPLLELSFIKYPIWVNKNRDFRVMMMSLLKCYFHQILYPKSGHPQYPKEHLA